MKWIASLWNKLPVVKDHIQVIAIICGGVWAFYAFVIHREASTNLSIAITPEVIKYDNPNRKILIANISLKNTGKVLITPNKTGCVVSFRRIPKKKTIGCFINWTGALPLVDGNPQRRVENINVLRVYDPAYQYEIEPGAEYHEREAIVVQTGETIMIKASFHIGTNDDAFTEYATVFIP